MSTTGKKDETSNRLTSRRNIDNDSTMGKNNRPSKETLAKMLVLQRENPPKDGESGEKYFARLSRMVYRQNYNDNQEARREEARKKVMMILNAAFEESHPEPKDPFLQKVVGVDTFIQNANSFEGKFKACKKAIGLRLDIAKQMVERKGLLKKEEEWKFVYKDEWKVYLYMNATQNIGEPYAHTKKAEIEKHEARVPWVHIKESQIEGAGYGCYAERKFREGAFVGMYMGSLKGKGQQGYTMAAQNGKTVSCFSIAHSKSVGAKSCMTMGMQMINDPTLYLDEDEEPPFAVNAKVMADMFVVAIKTIEIGEEIFIKYNWGEDGGGKPKAKNNNDEDDEEEEEEGDGSSSNDESESSSEGEESGDKDEGSDNKKRGKKGDNDSDYRPSPAKKGRMGKKKKN